MICNESGVFVDEKNWGLFVFVVVGFFILVFLWF